MRETVKITFVFVAIAVLMGAQSYGDWRETAKKKAQQVAKSDKTKAAGKAMVGAAISGGVNAAFDDEEYGSSVLSSMEAEGKKQMISEAQEHGPVGSLAATVAVTGGQAYSSSQAAKKAQEAQRQAEADAALEAHKEMVEQANK